MGEVFAAAGVPKSEIPTSEDLVPSKPKAKAKKAKPTAEEIASGMEREALAALAPFTLEEMHKELDKAIKMLGPNNFDTEIPVHVMMLGIAAVSRSRPDE